MSSGRIFLWEAGSISGTAATRDKALEAAGGELDSNAEALVEEAEMVMTAGLVPGHQRTGLAWRGRLEGGEPVWAPAGPGVP